MIEIESRLGVLTPPVLSRCLRVVVAGFTFGFLAVSATAPAEDELIKLFKQEAPFAAVPSSLFDRLGWPLPDNGSTVKDLADAAPGGAFDPRGLETIAAGKLGYRARWEVVRYNVYGVDWDISALRLTPNHPLAGMPTLVFVHGADANWYEFFVDQFNHPGLGQYLAQRVPVLLISIPGNFKYGGWSERKYDQRVPPYLLDRDLSPKEVKVRNAIYTFRVVADGVRKLIEQKTTGPVVIIGHSTAGDIPFMLATTTLKKRMNGMFLGWGSGGPATMKLTSPEQAKLRGESVASRFVPSQNVSDLGVRNDNGKSEDSYYRHIEPMPDLVRTKPRLTSRPAGRVRKIGAVRISSRCCRCMSILVGADCLTKCPGKSARHLRVMTSESILTK